MIYELRDDKSFKECIDNITLKAHTKYRLELIKMAKDSQLDPKPIRKMKAKGGHTMAESALDGESRNNKKQSGCRHKCGNDK